MRRSFERRAMTIPAWLLVPAPSATLAAVSTAHLALAALRRHRSRGSPLLVVPSALLVLAPWAFTKPAELAAGLALHAIWFTACERSSRAPASRPVAASTAVPAPRPSGFVATPVLAVVDETPDIRTFRLARPEGFEFEAGQFLTVRVHVDGKALVRCYSISSAPEARGYLEISVKRQGVVSGTLHSTVHAGSVLSVRPPAGPFVYPAGDDRRLVLIAGGVGVTPLMSMLRHAVTAEPGRPVTLLLSVRSERDVPFRDELRLLARRHPQVRITLAATRGDDGPGFYPGRVDERLLRQEVPDPAASLFYLCGPLPMIASMRELLARAGVPTAQVRAEAFEAAVAFSESAANARSLAERAGRPAAKHAVELARSGKSTTVAPAETLLEAAERMGAEIPSSCRAGVCQTCKTRVVEGDVDCTSDTLEASEREDGYVLPCVAWARSRCVLDA